MANMFDEIPSTEQGVIIYRDYAEKQIKESKLMIKRMEKIMVECNKRLEIMKNGKV